MKYYKNAQNELFVNPIISNHTGLTKITEQEFNEQLAINNSPQPLTPSQILSDALSDITWVRPSDSVEIQVRHPKYAPDGLVMQGAIDEMDSLADTEDWIAKDNSWVVVTKQDLIDALAFRTSEIKRLYAEYKVATENT